MADPWKAMASRLFTLWLISPVKSSMTFFSLLAVGDIEEDTRHQAFGQS